MGGDVLTGSTPAWVSEYSVNPSPSASGPSLVKSGSFFDNFLLTNDDEFAEEVENMTWGTRKRMKRSNGENCMKKWKKENRKKRPRRKRKGNMTFGELKKREVKKILLRNQEMTGS
ncbi:unnamed protein product [Rangifer tarandus platyrhynchus]|uniref:Uncharacterized protein n=1 Tax=Rangifer tarandus platyrhynchus TaxID=3082113 RepID=A0ABN8XX91_RANTA|nr:unnamed protein product [Rangifer tarandus platyrhynchus]